MKNIRTNLSLVLTIVLALVFASVYPAAAQNKPDVSKKELKVLLKTATQPADHQRIADYYQQEAARLTASAKEHQELAAIYAEESSKRGHGSQAWYVGRGRQPLPSLGTTRG